jgi:hypothetical protein
MSEEPERRNGRTRAKRWTEAEAREAIREWRGSGLSAAEFARKRGISAMRLPYWEQRLRASSGGEVSFVAVPLTSTHAVEVEHQGVTIRLRELGAEELARLVVAIARRAREC